MTPLALRVAARYFRASAPSCPTCGFVGGINRATGQQLWNASTEPCPRCHPQPSRLGEVLLASTEVKVHGPGACMTCGFNGYIILPPGRRQFDARLDPCPICAGREAGRQSLAEHLGVDPSQIGDEPSMTQRLAAKYKQKKKIKTQEGEDATVYVYSDKQIEHRNREKAKQVEKLSKSIDGLRTKVKKDMKSEDPEKKLTALAVALMDHTYERVGNDESAKDGHYGVTGWHKGHISFSKGKARLKYVGKSGVDHDKEVTDKAIVSALRDAYEAAEGEEAELFEWEGGKVTAEKVNAYLKQFDITAKDIRGYRANDSMANALREVRKKGGKLPTDKKEREKKLKAEFQEALEATADVVGHEAATLRSQYLVPTLEPDFMDNGKIDNSFV